MIELTKMREFMTKRVDEARILERFAGRHVGQPDSDRAVREAHSISTLDVRPFRFEDSVTQAETRTDAERVALETHYQLFLHATIQYRPPTGSFVIQS